MRASRAGPWQLASGVHCRASSSSRWIGPILSLQSSTGVSGPHHHRDIASHIAPQRGTRPHNDGRFVEVVEAERIGFVNDVASADELTVTVTACVTSLTEKYSLIIKQGRDSSRFSLSMSPGESRAYQHAALAITAHFHYTHEFMIAVGENREASWFD
jgi:hypothetical protein